MLNRPYLFDALRCRIDAALASGELFGLLFVRTQRVREYNLLFGYEAGDGAADAMHEVIATALRPEDEVVRIGECDFAVLLPGLRNHGHAAMAAAKLVRLFDAPVGPGGQGMQASIAIGAAFCPDDSTDPDLLCRLADSACDTAITRDDRYAAYRTPEFSSAFAHGDLREAIATNQLHLFLQPILRLAGGRIDRVEALSRWNHAELGAIPPDDFVRVAEQTGLIGDLTRWNFNVALRHAAASRDAGRPLAMSVNLSMAVLRQDNAIFQIGDAVRFWGIQPEAVVLEVTESALVDDLRHCGRLLRLLRDDGFGIAIDDFGTGYSSMAYLKRLPVTELKIDKSFVTDMRQDVRAEKLVGSMIDLSHHLGIAVVAEGVEDDVTLERLESMDCDHAQGYHIGRPGPARDVIEALHARTGA